MSGLAQDLPDGWWRSSIDALAEPKGVAYGVLKPGPQVEGGVPMLRVSDVRDGRVDQSQIYRIGDELDCEYRRTKLRGGEVLVSIQGSVGRAAVVPAELSGANVSRTLAMIRLREPELATWVQTALESPQAQHAMRQVVGGTTRDSLNLRDLRRLEILIAPEPQRSTLLSLIERLRQLNGSSAQHLAAARNAIERFRRAVLAAACSGYLTAAWREAHPDQCAISELLRDIEGRLSAKRRRVVDGFDASDLSELPSTWTWAPLAAVSDSVLGKMLDKAKNKGEPRPYLRNTNVRWRGFDLDDVSEMRFEAGEEERYGLEPGDVLVCEGGEPGRAAVWRDAESDMRFQKALHRVRCEGALLPDFLVNVLQAHAYSGMLAGYFTGSGIAHLTGVSLARVPVPLPPIEEQREIVRRVDQLLALADSLEQRIDAGSKRVERSSHAVLAKAFRGDLLPADSASLGQGSS